MKSGGAIRFEQRAGGRFVFRSMTSITLLHLDKLSKALEDQVASEDAADVGDARGFTFFPQLPADGSGKRRQLLGGVLQNMDRDLVAVNRCLVYQLREGSDTGARIFVRVEAVERIVGVARAGGLHERVAQSGRRTPAFLEAQRGAQGLA